jgi:glycosyltransferase involved in cell wall biosynthesis
MKILLFSTQWPEYMIELANAMSKKGDTILMLPNNYGLQEKHILCLSKEVRLITFKFIDFKSIRQNLKMLFSVLKVIRKEKPDILHIQANGHRSFYFVALLKPLKTKIVNTIHDPEKHLGDKLSLAIDDSVAIYLMRFFTKKYIVHGRALITNLSKSYSVKSARIVSIPHGHFEIYKKLQVNRSNRTDDFVLFFGRIWEYKGLEYFIKAANVVHKSMPDVRFCIAGKGESLVKYLTMIENRERFLIIDRRIPIDEVGILFEQASVVVLPYIEATQSGVIPIAYAYSKPVIASKVGGLPDVVIDSVTGYLVESKSGNQIAEKIIHLLNNPEERLKMGSMAYAYAMKELSWDKIANRTFEVYQSIVVEDTCVV